jgi:hypothetical protein
MTPERRAYLDSYAASRFPPDVRQLIEEMTPMPPDAGPRAKAMILDLRKAIEAGFILAVSRYNKELKSNAEAMRLVSARKTGAANGRRRSSQRREELAERIRATWVEMDAAGKMPTNAKVAAACECGISTVIRAFKSKPAKRTKR